MAGISELFNMNVRAYLFTVNKNNSCKLSTDELKDVIQETEIYLSKLSLNDLLQKKTAIRTYVRAVKKKIENEEFVRSEMYYDLLDSTGHDKETARLEKMKDLNLVNEKQKKIVEFLIKGYTYSEIRQRLGLNSRKLIGYIQRIKEANEQGPQPQTASA